MEKPMNPKDREDTMKHWDRWHKYIAEGGGRSWPRDSFESLLDYFMTERFEIGERVVDDDGNRGFVVIVWNDGDMDYVGHLVSHPNPVVVETK